MILAPSSGMHILDLGAPQRHGGKLSKMDGDAER